MSLTVSGIQVPSPDSPLPTLSAQARPTLFPEETLRRDGPVTRCTQCLERNHIPSCPTSVLRYSRSMNVSGSGPYLTGPAPTKTTGERGPRAVLPPHRTPCSGPEGQGEPKSLPYHSGGTVEQSSSFGSLGWSRVVPGPCVIHESFASTLDSHLSEYRPSLPPTLWGTQRS